ncbi:MAG: preprotein translocase subunit SecA, partial [Ruminococcaceae bacterium]|nr:preprotein translocase subunit SecA [Oscillospiraceae bacterium]
KVEEDMPLENNMLSHTIENAQKKKEGMNFAIRKNVLQYDDVMNKQRELIYSQRAKVLDGEEIKNTILRMIDDTIDSYCQIFLADPTVHDNWDVKGLREHFLGWITTPEDLRFTTEELADTSREEVAESLKEKARKIYEMREKEFGSELMREIERVMLLRSVDTNWMDHIDAMDQLRQGIGLRAYGQHDPVIEYRNDSYDMFEAMNNSIREQTAKLVLSVRVKKDEEVKREKVAKETSTGDKPLTVKGKGAVGKNAPCPCGSGKKYKRCCGKDID